MAKIYLPTEYVNSSCKVVYDDYIRVFDNDSRTSWTDVFYKSNYYVKRGESAYTSTVSCDNLNTFTDDVFYRYDFDKSLMMFFIFAVVLIYFPYKIFSRAFGRWLRV